MLHRLINKLLPGFVGRPNFIHLCFCSYGIYVLLRDAIEVGKTRHAHLPRAVNKDLPLCVLLRMHPSYTLSISTQCITLRPVLYMLG